MKRSIAHKHYISAPVTKVYNHAHLSEYDIIELHNTFLTVGLQSITVPSASAGRSLIYMILNSLSCYHACAALTTYNELQGSIYDIYQGINPDLACATIDELMMNNFDHADFVWIEATENMLSQHWFSYFEQQLIACHITKSIPVVIVTYE